MDPVLSSTIEFDEYIKSNLNLTGKRFSCTAASTKTDKNRNGNSNIQPSVGTRGSMHDNKSRNVSNNLSQEFLQLNIRKYDQSTNGPPRQSRSAGSSTRPLVPVTEVASPSPRIPLQHSWKAHLSTYNSRNVASGSHAGGSTGRIRNTSTGTSVPAWRYPENDFSDDILEPKSPLTKPRSPLKIVPADYSGISKMNTGSLEVSKSYDDSEFSIYKVRLVTLKRIFSTWTAVCKVSRKLLARNCRDVHENSLYWPKYTCFTWWVLLYQAVTHAQVSAIRRAINTLWKGYKVSRRRRVLLRKAQYHYDFIRIVQYFSYFVRLGKKCQQRRQTRRMEIRARNFHNLGLARRVIHAWRQVVAKIRADRLLDAEHNVRREKIALFMRRMQSPTDAPSTITSATTSPSPSRTNASSGAINGSTGTTGASMSSNATNRGQRQPSSALAHRRTTASSSVARTRGPGLQIKQADLHGNVRTRTRDNSINTMQNEADSKEQEYMGMRDNGIRDSKESTYHQYELNSDESSEQYSADEDFEEAEDVPPSYDALMRQSHSSIQDAKESSPARPTSISQRQNLQRSNGEVSNRQTISDCKNKENPTAVQKATATSNTVTLSDTTAAGIGMTFAERAAARRQRSLLLRKQAEERVQEKTQMKIAAEREKQEKEAEEAEAIRKEARAQQIQAKAYADRRRTEQADTLRELLDRAKKFRAQQLIVRWGIAPWQQLMELARINSMKAESYRNDRLLHAAWSALLGYIIALRTERYRKEHRQSAIAVAHYRRKLLKFVWRTMRLHHKMLTAKCKALTGHFSRYTLRKRSFQAWRVAYERSVRMILRQLRSVQPRGDRSVKRYYFQQWLNYHAGALEDREIRQRVNSKWAAVQSWMSST